MVRARLAGATNEQIGARPGCCTARCLRTRTRHLRVLQIAASIHSSDLRGRPRSSTHGWRRKCVGELLSRLPELQRCQAIANFCRRSLKRPPRCAFSSTGTTVESPLPVEGRFRGDSGEDAYGPGDGCGFEDESSADSRYPTATCSIGPSSAVIFPPALDTSALRGPPGGSGINRSIRLEEPLGAVSLPSVVPRAQPVIERLRMQ